MNADPDTARQLDGNLERCTSVRHLQFGFQATLAWVVAALASAPADLATFKAEDMGNGIEVDAVEHLAAVLDCTRFPRLKKVELSFLNLVKHRNTGPGFTSSMATVQRIFSDLHSRGIFVTSLHEW